MLLRKLLQILYPTKFDIQKNCSFNMKNNRAKSTSPGRQGVLNIIFIVAASSITYSLVWQNMAVDYLAPTPSLSGLIIRWRALSYPVWRASPSPGPGNSQLSKVTSSVTALAEWQYLQAEDALQETRCIAPMLVLCWATIADGGPTWNQHCINIAFFLDCWWVNIGQRQTPEPNTEP